MRSIRKTVMALSLVAAVVTPQQAAAQADDPVIMTINGTAVPRSEFEYSYNKNNSDGVIDKKTVDEYVDLFINYKLAVAAAMDARLDTLTSFRNEYTMYRDQQVRPTMVTDADVLAEARRAYEQAKEQIGPGGLLLPAHILVSVSTKATQAEQDRAKLRADSIWQALQGGADFATLAKAVSDDRGTAEKGGELPYWIGPNQTLKEFEDAAYSLQTGQMSRPVLSPVGWHIIKMNGRKQLEPFDSLKTNIVRAIERQGIRERIADQRVQQTVDANAGLTKAQVMDMRADSLAEADLEMKYLMQEYHDGLLLYEIKNRQVWEKADKDDAGLDAYFRSHRDKYTWQEPRFRGVSYQVRDKKDIKTVKKTVKKLPFKQWESALKKVFVADSVIRARISVFKPGDDALVDREVFKVTPAETPEVSGQKEKFPFSATYGKKLRRPELYSDVRPQVVADYQEELDKAWTAELRRRYSFKVNQEVLKTVNKHP